MKKNQPLTFEVGLTKPVPKNVFQKIQQFSTGALAVALVEWVHFDLCYSVRMDPNFEQFVYVLLFELAERGSLK